MHSTRKIIRAFLASPGDLQEEREAIRAVVDEFNGSLADVFGYQVELLGWEDAVSRFGRPQQIINQKVDRCDLFLGMIWRRWGTPPDHNGDYTSGFEEEFERSVSRREKTGSPEISLFFKRIPDDIKVDPGEDLKKVIEFKKNIIARKNILYQEFSTVHDMEKRARSCVNDYVKRVKADHESSDRNEVQAKRAQSDSEETSEYNRKRESSPSTDEDFAFLDGFVKKIKKPESLDALGASDIARFRLIANSISKQGNDENKLGVHDINILFTARTDGMELRGPFKTSTFRLAPACNLNIL